MGGEQLAKVEVDRLQAAVLEQRRLSHMLRQRGGEIEALREDRERLGERERRAREREEQLSRRLREAEEAQASLESELAQAHYELRRGERRLARHEAAAAEELQRKSEERERLEAELAQERERLEAELGGLRGRLGEVERELRAALDAQADLETRLEVQGTELRQARYEARRAERRTAKHDRDAADARRQSRLQLESLAAELRAGLAARDEALEALETTRKLGRTERDVELLVSREREREAQLARSRSHLEEVAEQLSRARASRSWRWGHAIAQAPRELTFRPRSGRSALDAALERLEGAGHGRSAAGERGA